MPYQSGKLAKLQGGKGCGVTLDQIKAREDLAQMVLVNNSRLSVQPVTDEQWNIICALGETKP